MRSIVERLEFQRKYSHQLNPLLFAQGDHLYLDVRDKINEIVRAFLEYLQVDIRVLDVRIVGSNASYNYNEHSDLDIHIVTSLSEISDPETIARLYFDAAKKNFKDAYDITIKGIDVELYVEDIKASAVSNGIYSVTHDTWIKTPTPMENPSDEVVKQAEKYEEYILDILSQATTVEEVQDVQDQIYLIRKDSLSDGGEVSAGNLMFKSLRNKGILDDIKTILHKGMSKELSLESMRNR